MSPAISACPSDDDLAAVVDGRGSEDTITRLELHLDQCASCRAAVGMLATRQPSMPPITDADPGGSLQPVDPAAYEVRAELARGGMGLILDAWDRRHGRRVAIKVLLRNEPTMLARFVREARITARLQHPSIMPFYEAGRWSDGEPFFAMKLIEGHSLADAIALRPRFAERIALVSHLIAATDALAYAHAAGVIHRDLKPANVLVGAYGETVVIDWGIAKHVRDAPEPHGEARPLDGPALVTMTGSALGTPSYMAPEQAAGRPVDPRADVYSLGALIYHVLAGAPPYSGATPVDVISQVLRGPPARLAECAPAAPADLVAIADKAMARDPADRYASADQMAADLREFTAGRVVSAREYPLRALLGRWLSRHRAVVAMAALLVIVVTATATLDIERVVRERDRADQAKQLADEQRHAAEALVEYMVGQLRAKLETTGRLELLAGLGNEVRSYYERIAPSDAALDAAALDRRATALQTLGGVEEEKQNMDGALALYGTATALFAKAEARQPDDVDARAGAVEDLIRVARIQQTRGKMDEATRALDDATAHAERVLAATPDPRFQMLLSKARGTRGFVLAALGQGRASFDAYVGALALAIRATAAAPGRAEWQAQLGRAYFDVGYAEAARNNLDAAAEAYARSAEVRARAATLPMANTDGLRRDLAWTYMMLGSVERSRGHIVVAIEDATRARQTTSELRRHDPDNRDYARDSLAALYEACEILFDADRFDDAVTACREAIPIGEALLDHDPTSDTAHDDLRRVYAEAARAELARARAEAARPLLARAQVIAEQADRAAHNVRNVRNVGDVLTLMARLDLATGDLAAAGQHYARGLAAAVQAVREFPGDDDNDVNLAEARLVGALVEIARGRPAAASPLYEGALALEAGLLEREPRAPATQRAISELLRVRSRLPGRCTEIPALAATLSRLPRDVVREAPILASAAALPPGCPR